jgi:hypothetical protein
MVVDFFLESVYNVSMKCLNGKQRISGSVLLAATALFTLFFQTLAPHCICDPACAMQEEGAAKANHSCCEAAEDPTPSKPISGASLIRRCNCPPVLREAIPVITNAPERGHEHFKVFAVATTCSSVVAARNFGQATISESPPPKQGLTTSIAPCAADRLSHREIAALGCLVTPPLSPQLHPAAP